MSKVISTLVLLICYGFSLCAQVKNDALRVRIMFYNVENLFDTRDDSTTSDEEFLPQGLMRWNRTRYEHKINAVSKTIVAAGEWDPPAIVAFAEIENRKVLEDLVYGPALSRFQYGIIHENSPDPRGIDVCMIFRRELVKIIDHRSWIPSSVKKSDFHTRSVLYVKCLVSGDTLHLIVNHWPSRRGGVLAGEDLREKIADMVRTAADSLGRMNPGRSKIIILGDFNCGPDSPVMQSLVNNAHSNKDTTGLNLINLAEHRNMGYGTYRYQGSWETLDQILVSEAVLNCNKGLIVREKNFTIYRPDFLLVRDTKYPGLSPFSTYRGYRYQGGFSDHLPVMTDLVLR
jgi:predicted extracellular nuclease